MDPLLGTDYHGDDEVLGDFTQIHGDELDPAEPLPGLALVPQLIEETDSAAIILEKSPTPVSQGRLSMVAQMAPLDLMEKGDDTEDEQGDDGEVKVFEIESNGSSEKQICFYEDLSEFLEWESNVDADGTEECGIRIKEIKNNEFGRALRIESKLKKGWQITIIDGDYVALKMKVYILNRIQKCNAKKGFHVTFERKRRNSVLRPSLYKKAKGKKKVNG